MVEYPPHERCSGVVHLRQQFRLFRLDFGHEMGCHDALHYLPEVGAHHVL